MVFFKYCAYITNTTGFRSKVLFTESCKGQRTKSNERLNLKFQVNVNNWIEP